MPPAQQRLHAKHRAIAHGDDRLVAQAKVARCEGLGQVVGDAQAAGGGGVHFGHEMHQPAAGLCGIQRDVGGDQQRRRPRRSAGNKPQPRIGGKGIAGGQQRPAQRLQHGTRHGFLLRRGCVGQHGRGCRAGASQQHALAQHGAQPFRRLHGKALGQVRPGDRGDPRQGLQPQQQHAGLPARQLVQVLGQRLRVRQSGRGSRTFSALRSASASARRCVTSAASLACDRSPLAAASARPTTSAIASSPKGLRRKSKAPVRTAATASSSVACPVMTISAGAFGRRLGQQVPREVQPVLPRHGHVGHDHQDVGPVGQQLPGRRGRADGLDRKARAAQPKRQFLGKVRVVVDDKHCRFPARQRRGYRSRGVRGAPGVEHKLAAAPKPLSEGR